MSTHRVILNLRSDYVQQLDALVKRGAAPSRNALIERIIAGFLSDLKTGRQADDSALGNLVGFIMLMLGVGIIASIFGEKTNG